MDDAFILKILQRRLGASRQWGEAFAMLGGFVVSFVLIGVLVTVVYGYFVFNASFRYSRSVADFNVSTWIALMAIGVLMSVLIAYAQGGWARGLEGTLESTAYNTRWIAPYASGELMAAGCLASFSRFLGGNILVCVIYFFRRPALSYNQFVVATGVVSALLANREAGVDVLHDGILHGQPNLTEHDFEKALTTLRKYRLVLGQSYLELSDELRAELVPSNF